MPRRNKRCVWFVSNGSSDDPESDKGVVGVFNGTADGYVTTSEVNGRNGFQ